ncbi:MAG: hypothetical protein AB1407_03965 [Spirochaetota bacterium]
MIGKEKSAAMRSLVFLAAFMMILGPSAFAEPKTQGPRFSLVLAPGKAYKASGGWFIFRYPVYPQVAAWVESLDGTYMGTIYVTGKAEKKNWIAAPASGRPEALPVWSHLDKEKLDAVTAATSKGSTLRDSDLAARLKPGTYVVMLETNRSYDYNSTYTKGASGVNGQPSIVYKALIQVGKGAATATFEPIGTRSVDGRDGSIRPSLEGIDTALELFSALTVEYKE